MAAKDKPKMKSSQKPATRQLDDNELHDVTGGEHAEHCQPSDHERAKLFINQVIQTVPPPQKR